MFYGVKSAIPIILMLKKLCSRCGLCSRILRIAFVKQSQKIGNLSRNKNWKTTDLDHMMLGTKYNLVITQRKIEEKCSIVSRRMS